MVERISKALTENAKIIIVMSPIIRPHVPLSNVLGFTTPLTADNIVSSFIHTVLAD